MISMLESQFQHGIDEIKITLHTVIGAIYGKKVIFFCKRKFLDDMTQQIARQSLNYVNFHA